MEQDRKEGGRNGNSSVISAARTIWREISPWSSKMTEEVLGEVVTGPSSLRAGHKVFMEIQEGESDEGRFSEHEDKSL